MEIILVSQDKHDFAFDDYFKMMPWLSLSFENKEFRYFLKDYYKIKGIPTLILIDSQNGVKFLFI